MNQPDPEDLNQEVRELRIEQLKKEAEALSGKPLFTSESGNLPLALQEEFWRQVVAFEHMARKNVSLFDYIHREDTPFPAPEILDDQQIHTRLWVLVAVLSRLRVYLEHTDHLNDRELYSELWRNTLREVLVMDEVSHSFNCHIDLVGSGSDEDIEMFLRYYADDTERSEWAKDLPDITVPERKSLPYDRDRLLPKPKE